MTEQLNVKFKGAIPPVYQTSGSSGCDLISSVDTMIPPRQWKVVPTGLFLEIPEGYEGQVRSRSGLASKYGVFVLNSPGTCDSDYRGEIKVVLFNQGNTNFEIKVGDRIAQLVFSKVTQATFCATGDLSSTDRGQGGFGSTGV